MINKIILIDTLQANIEKLLFINAAIGNEGELSQEELAGFKNILHDITNDLKQVRDDFKRLVIPE